MEPQLWVVAAAVALPFVGAGVTPLLARLLGERVGYAGAAIAFVSFGLVASLVGTSTTVSAPWIPSLDVAVRFTVDGWAVLFALLASGIGVLVFLYSTAYMADEPGQARYYATLLAFMGSILGVAFAADLVALFVFWELTSVSSFVLIGHYTDDETAQYSARMAMVVTVGAGLCLLVALVVLSLAAEVALGTRTFDLAAMLAEPEAMQTALRETGLYLPALSLVAVAAGAKSAQVPLHFWLPNAMVAPTPVSAFLHSATMVKVGVYVVGRLRPMLLGEEWTLLFATLGLLTMTAGAALAVLATDIKRLLAYSTASHLGLMIAGFGFATHYGAEAGAFHLFNHALFKAALFLVAGVVAHEVGTRDLRDLGGLWRALPVTAAVTTVTALSMAGVPPFNGFYSKELLFEAAYETAAAAGGLAWLYPAVAVLASVLTVVYSLRFLFVFFGRRPDEIGDIHRPPVALVGPPALLATLAAVVSVAPGLAVDAVVQRALDATTVEAVELHAGLPTSLSPPVLMSAVALVAGVGAFAVDEQIRSAVGRATILSPLVRPSWWYRELVTGAERASAWLGPRVHDGRLRTYATWSLGTACGLALAGYAAAAGIPELAAVDVPLAMALVLAVAVGAGATVTTAPSHVAGVLTLSIFGFMVAIFFILASAPDLALTQLVVETLLLLIFLLVIEELPAFYGELDARVAARDVALSVGVGATAFVSVLFAARGPEEPLTATASYYVRQAVPGAGGTNVVNVVLVDFRGFDTLGELLVVTVAAISAFVLVIMRTRGESG
jgi:multicomponent Na+:H+ antiporter subunit A